MAMIMISNLREINKTQSCFKFGISFDKFVKMWNASALVLRPQYGPGDDNCK